MQIRRDLAQVLGAAEFVGHEQVRDRRETVDLRSLRGDVVATMREQATAQSALERREPLRSANIDPETERELRALGYLE